MGYQIGAAFTATGTVTVSGGGTGVVGVGTAFLTQFAAGYLIIVQGQVRVVASVTNDTNLVATANWSSGAAGVAFQGVNLKDTNGVLTTTLTDPKSEPVTYSMPLALGDGTLRGGGWTKTTWSWGFLSQADRDALKAFCAGYSAKVYIQTRKADYTFAYYYATMIWPVPEERQTGRALNLQIAFQALEEQVTS